LCFTETNITVFQLQLLLWQHNVPEGDSALGQNMQKKSIQAGLNLH